MAKRVQTAKRPFSNRARKGKVTYTKHCSVFTALPYNNIQPSWLG